MRHFTFYRSCILLSGLITLISLSVIAQPRSGKPIKQTKETSAEEVFKRFITEDVPYIITSDELEAYKRLKTNEERENFIENFWRRRDPDPDTEENEFRDEYYERIAYANEHFTSGIPGWKTDRGRIYITHGKPDSIESHPSGGSYDRPSYEGGGSTTTYPFETWFYRNIDDVGTGIEIEFVDPTGTGEYRIARNANEKDALLFVPGAGRTLAEQLNLETRDQRISGFNNASYQRTQDTPFERLRIAQGLMSPPKPKDTGLYDIIKEDSPIVLDQEMIDFDVQVDFFRQSDESVVTTFTIQTDNKELTFKDSGGIPTAKMNIFGKVTNVSGRRAGIFEDSVSAASTPEELALPRGRKSIYQNAIALTPGSTYKLAIAVRDIDSGRVGLKKIGFTIPKFNAGKLSTSTLILASSLAATTEKDIGARFVIGDKKVIPNLSATYSRGHDLGYYLQIYNAEIDQTTLRPAVDIEYTITQGKQEISRYRENWNGLSDNGQRLVLAGILPTGNLAAGEYQLNIIIKDRVTGQVIEPSAKFRVIE